MRGPGRAWNLRLGGLVALGVALRVLYLVTVGRDVTGIGDWFFYHWQANLIADGRGFLEPYRLRFDGLALPSAGHPPLYPLALSVVSWLGGTGVFSHRLLGVPLGALTIALVGLLGRRVGGDRVGLWAAGLCAIYPTMIAVDGALMSETLYGPLIAASLLAAVALLERPRRRVALALGVGIGLAALTRSEALLLVPLLGVPVAVRGGRGWPVRVLAVAAGCALVVLPWTARNLDAFGRLVPISNNDSTVIAGANCPASYAGIGLGGWDVRCISDRREDNEARQAAIWRREGLEYAGDHLSRLPVVLAVRLLRVWDLYQPRRQVMFAEGRSIRVTQAGLLAYFGLLLLGGLGMVALRRRGIPLVVLLAPAAAVCVAALVGYGVPRLRHSFEIPLLVLAAAGVVRLLEARRA